MTQPHDEELYKATPQTIGDLAHQGSDNKSGSTRKDDIMALHVWCDELGIFGRIDMYKSDRHLLVERKNQLKRIFRGQIYQLWGQYFCLTEMGYPIDHLAFYEIRTRAMDPIELPNEEEKRELKDMIERFRLFDPASTPFDITPNKCTHCIYCNLCDKTESDNVYT